MAEQKADNWEDLRLRLVSAFVIAGIGLGCVLTGGFVFAALVVFASIIMMQEWDQLMVKQPKRFRQMGYLYITLPCASLLWLRGLSLSADPIFGLTLIITLTAVITATDSGAYFVGRKWGKHKLAPAISPKKTIEGLMGGVVLAMLTGGIFIHFLSLPVVKLPAILLCGVIAVIAQMGDLFKSWLKRQAGVKDSGTLIPGHGGMIDRLDGYMFATPLLALIVYIYL